MRPAFLIRESYLSHNANSEILNELCNQLYVYPVDTCCYIFFFTSHIPNISPFTLQRLYALTFYIPRKLYIMYNLISSVNYNFHSTVYMHTYCYVIPFQMRSVQAPTANCSTLSSSSLARRTPPITTLVVTTRSARR